MTQPQDLCDIIVTVIVTRSITSTAINAAVLALVDAGVYMTDLIAAVTIGRFVSANHKMQLYIFASGMCVFI
jgi:ribonuclease PH